MVRRSQPSPENALIKCITVSMNGACVPLELTYFGEEVSDVPPISVLFKDCRHRFNHHGASARVP